MKRLEVSWCFMKVLPPPNDDGDDHDPSSVCLEKKSQMAVEATESLDAFPISRTDAYCPAPDHVCFRPRA